jgi:hypothetical protein
MTWYIQINRQKQFAHFVGAGLQIGLAGLGRVGVFARLHRAKASNVVILSPTVGLRRNVSASCLPNSQNVARAAMTPLAPTGDRSNTDRHRWHPGNQHLRRGRTSTPGSPVTEFGHAILQPPPRPHSGLGKEIPRLPISIRLRDRLPVASRSVERQEWVDIFGERLRSGDRTSADPL